MDATRCLDDLDRDFKYKHANDSHSWITDYPSSLRPDPNSLKISFKNEVFAEPEVRRESTKGRRKKLLEAFYRQVISEEVFGQFDAEEVVSGDYETHYMEKFKNPDDMPLPGEKLSKNDKFKKENQSCPHDLSKQSKLEEEGDKPPSHDSEALPITPEQVFSDVVYERGAQRVWNGIQTGAAEAKDLCLSMSKRLMKVIETNRRTISY